MLLCAFHKVSPGGTINTRRTKIEVKPQAFPLSLIESSIYSTIISLLYDLGTFARSQTYVALEVQAKGSNLKMVPYNM